MLGREKWPARVQAKTLELANQFSNIRGGLCFSLKELRGANERSLHEVIAGRVPARNDLYFSGWNSALGRDNILYIITRTRTATTDLSSAGVSDCLGFVVVSSGRGLWLRSLEGLQVATSRLAAVDHPVCGWRWRWRHKRQ